MSDLYARRNPVFVEGTYTHTPIVDMRIHWTAAQEIEGTIDGLNPGDTKATVECTAETGAPEATVIYPTISITFTGRHPLVSSKYYSYTFSWTAPVVSSDRYNVNGSIFNVSDTPNGHLVYILKADNNELRLVSLQIVSPVFVAILDFDDVVTSDTYTGIIAPFNVIFDNIPYTLYTPILTAGETEAALAGTPFTNQPTLVTNGCIVRPVPAYNFVLIGNTLSFTKNIPEAATGVDKIVSINGITATNGDIQIKILK